MSFPRRLPPFHAPTCAVLDRPVALVLTFCPRRGLRHHHRQSRSCIGRVRLTDAVFGSGRHLGVSVAQWQQQQRRQAEKQQQQQRQGLQGLQQDRRRPQEEDEEVAVVEAWQRQEEGQQQQRRRGKVEQQRVAAAGEGEEDDDDDDDDEEEEEDDDDDDQEEEEDGWVVGGATDDTATWPQETRPRPPPSWVRAAVAACWAADCFRRGLTTTVCFVRARARRRESTSAARTRQTQRPALHPATPN